MRENVALGRRDDDGQAAAVIGEVGLKDVVAHLPDGMETLLGRQFEGGTDLSGGSGSG